MATAAGLVFLGLGAPSSWPLKDRGAVRPSDKALAGSEGAGRGRPRAAGGSACGASAEGVTDRHADALR